MTKILSLFIILFLFFSCNSPKTKEVKNEDTKKLQQVVLKPQTFISELPGRLNEISGLIIYDDLIWGFNDSGGENKVYAFNTSGEIKKVIELEKAKNQDWESITQDDKNIYIGDFGNNMGDRKNLCIYKIKKKDIGKKKDKKLEAKKIGFSYVNQDKYLFFDKSTPFDCEAMVEFDGSLYIFSKDWKDFTTTTYKVPTKKGKYKLQALDTFNVNGLVTGADISPDKNQLALVGYQNYRSYLWLFTSFPEDDFFKGEYKSFELPEINGAQTEGICYYGNDSLLISCENARGFQQQVFLLDISALKNGTH